MRPKFAISEFYLFSLPIQPDSYSAHFNSEQVPTAQLTSVLIFL